MSAESLFHQILAWRLTGGSLARRGVTPSSTKIFCDSVVKPPQLSEKPRSGN
jgi:hypothetical protein